MQDFVLFSLSLSRALLREDSRSNAWRVLLLDSFLGAFRRSKFRNKTAPGSTLEGVLPPRLLRELDNPTTTTAYHTCMGTSTKQHINADVYTIVSARMQKHSLNEMRHCSARPDDSNPHVQAGSKQHATEHQAASTKTKPRNTWIYFSKSTSKTCSLGRDELLQTLKLL